MNPHALGLCLVCAVSVSLISLISSQIYRRETLITSELMALVSFLPGFLYGIVAVFSVNSPIGLQTLATLFIKNTLYCISFYFRYESLRKFGPFIGALMLGTQPIFLCLFGSAILGEQLSLAQEFGVLLSAVGLFALTRKDHTAISPISLSDFSKYYFFPTFFSALIIVIDRFYLRGGISGGDFFIWDRITLIPSFILGVVLLRRRSFTISFENLAPILARQWKSLVAIGLLFSISGYTYSLALGLEKAAIVGTFRNTSYPVAAFVGSMMVQQRTSPREWFSLLAILAAVISTAL